MDLDPATQPTPEQEKSKEADNARKFITEPLDPAFLEANGAAAHTMITDWLVTDEDSETKLVRKEFDTGEVEVFLISKTLKDGKRDKEKEAITEERYKG